MKVKCFEEKLFDWLVGWLVGWSKKGDIFLWVYTTFGIVS